MKKFLLLLALTGCDPGQSQAIEDQRDTSLSQPCTVTIQPGQFINKATNGAKPGTTICVADGTYTESVYLNTSGTKDAWITLKALNPGQAKLTGGVSIGAMSYVEVSGFDVTNPNGVGIYAGNCTELAKCGHHQKITANTVHDCAAGGIAMSRGDYRLITGNTVYRNAFTNASAYSGISLWQSSDVVTTDTAGWQGFRNVISGNTVYSNDNCVRLADDRYSVPSKCIASATDGNGIIVDDSKNTQAGHVQGPYQGNFLIENNLVYNNGGAGIHSFYSARVTVRANHVFWNHRRPSTSTWKGELSNVASDGNTWQTNVAVANTCPNAIVKPTFETASTGTTWSGNTLSTLQACGG